MASDWNLPDIQDLERAVPLQQTLEILHEPLARYALYTLEEHGSLELDELSDITAAWANASEGTITQPIERDRVRTALYHVYLPKLDENGIVTFDQTSLSVALEDQPDELASLLEQLRQQESGPEDPDSSS